MEVASVKGTRPAASPPSLRASRRNALQRHYENGCAAPNEANFHQMELAAGVCRIAGYIREGGLVHLNKRSQCACNRWLRKRLEITGRVGRPGGKSQIAQEVQVGSGKCQGDRGRGQVLRVFALREETPCGVTTNTAVPRQTKPISSRWHWRRAPAGEEAI